MTTRHILIAMWAAWAAYWLYRAFRTKTATYRLNPLWRILAVAAVIGLGIFFRNEPQYFSRQLVPVSASSEAAGIALCAAGLCFAVWARVALGSNWSGNPTIKEGHELIQSGPYRLVRHPIYTGILLALFGTCLAGGRLDHLAAFLATVALLVAKLRFEERLMMKQFPQAYPAYRRRTKALIPFIV